MKSNNSRFVNSNFAFFVFAYFLSLLKSESLKSRKNIYKIRFLELKDELNGFFITGKNDIKATKRSKKECFLYECLKLIRQCHQLKLILNSQSKNT